MALRDCLARLNFDDGEAAALDAELQARLVDGADAARVADALVLEQLQAAITERNQLRAELTARTAPASGAPRPAEPIGLAEPPDMTRTDPTAAAGQVASQADASLQRYIDAGLLRADDPELLELARITQIAERDFRVVEAAGFCLSRQ
jgi:hypothetical protein